jgi:hypothetical protein
MGTYVVGEERGNPVVCDETVGELCDAFLAGKGTSYEKEGCPLCDDCRFQTECFQVMETKGVHV